jgi:hypothetical protein
MIYLMLNLGISVKIHYCGDSVSFIDFFPVEQKNCCKNKQASCCKDKIAYINPETTQASVQAAQFSFPDFAKFNLVVQDFSFLSAIESQKSEENVISDTDPVFYRKVPLYLTHRVIIV